MSEVITKFPAEELLVAGRKYWTAGGALNTLRESQSNLNTAAGRGDDPPKPAAGAGRGDDPPKPPAGAGRRELTPGQPGGGSG